VTISVKNEGAEDAVYVAWTTTFSGGLVLIPQERHYQGTIEELTPGAEVVVQQQTMVGFVRIDVTVTAEPAAAMRR
jgi:hypothetical protein